MKSFVREQILLIKISVNDKLGNNPVARKVKREISNREEKRTKHKIA